MSYSSYGTHSWRPAPRSLGTVGAFLVLLGLIVSPTGSAASEHAATDSTRALVPAPPVIEIPTERVIADTLQVRREKLSLREIIARSIEGERTKLSGRRSMTYTSTVRVIATWKDKREIEDLVMRSYADVEGTERTAMLGAKTTHFLRENGEWVLDPDPDQESDNTVQVEAGGPNDFEELPIFFDEIHEYDFELVDRFVQTDHVIFRIAFRPKSEFKPLPSGTLYVDTDRYRIIQEEYEFGKNPFPLVLKDLKRVSRQWTELPGGEWVNTKIRGEVELRADPFGWIPQSVAFAYTRTDFEFDVEYDQRLFGER